MTGEHLDDSVFEMSCPERVVEGLVGGFIFLLNLTHTHEYYWAFFGLELILDSTFLKGEGVGMLKWGLSQFISRKSK